MIWAYPQHPILTHFRPSGPSANNRYGHLESNALIDIEFGEFHQKLKTLEFHQISIFWESLGAIWIDSVSFEVVSPPNLQSSEGSTHEIGESHEIGEFRKKSQSLEFQQNSICWESWGAIWIDSVSFEVVPPLSFFSFFSIFE